MLPVLTAINPFLMMIFVVLIAACAHMVDSRKPGDETRERVFTALLVTGVVWGTTGALASAMTGDMFMVGWYLALFIFYLYVLINQLHIYRPINRRKSP